MAIRVALPRFNIASGTPSAQRNTMMQATFFQKVILCAIAAFLAASLIEWGKMFVTGADDALNKGYKHTTDINAR